MNVLNISLDNRANCFSVLTVMTIADYFRLVESAYGNRGAIVGQRAPLKTKTAQRVRERMVADLTRGAILPPIVLGVLLSQTGFKAFAAKPTEYWNELFQVIDPKKHIGIIDGMQRTTALYEAMEKGSIDTNREIRIEFWIASGSNSMLYRMLVLNSGQIPWNLRRQIEVIYRQFKEELEEKIPNLQLITSDDKSRRKKPGEYQSDQFIELYLLFGLRKTKVSLQEQITEEFARLDFIESSSKESFTDHFEGIARHMVNYDIAISRCEIDSVDFEPSRFKSGKDIFTSQPAKVGFMVAASRYIYGLPGVERSEEVSDKNFERLSQNLENHTRFLNSCSVETLTGILELSTLDERIKIPSPKVGEFEREFFLKSFTAFFQLLETDTSLRSYQPLWVA